MKIEILIGLPGSGKTHYAKAKEYVDKDGYGYYGKNVKVVDFDRFNERMNEPIENTIRYVMRSYDMEYTAKHDGIDNMLFIFDGLFLTNAVQHAMLKSMYDYFSECRVNPMPRVHIVFFREDRKACINNDSVREENRCAATTIKSAVYEKPDIEKLRQEFPHFNMTMTEMPVYALDAIDKMLYPYRDYWQPGLIKSESWSLGGTWADCWGNEGTCGPDEQPDTFEKFDEIIEKLCPKISHADYMKLYKASVTVETERHYDYYGGCENYSYYQCDIEKFKQKLKELKLLDGRRYKL